VTDLRSREYPTRPIVGVGAVVLVRPGDRAGLGIEGQGPEDGVLLVRRRFPPLQGQWSLPGGTVEIGEQLATAAAREVAEETGLAVEVRGVVDVIDRIEFDAEGRVQYHFVLVEYLCRPAGGRLQAATDATAVAVADSRALDAYGLPADTRGVIRRAVEMAHNPGDPW
jgi:ADP-ribose pyrophosphatase YjhB (NUDIX family)